MPSRRINPTVVPVQAFWATVPSVSPPATSISLASTRPPRTSWAVTAYGTDTTAERPTSSGPLPTETPRYSVKPLKTVDGIGVVAPSSAW